MVSGSILFCEGDEVLLTTSFGPGRMIADLSDETADVWIERMDEEWEKRGDVEAPLCKQKPSEYITQGNWFFATEPEEKMLPYVIERIGDDRIVFASDYPHWDAMFPRVVSTIRGRQDISESAKEKILGKNAKALYGWNA